MLLSAMVFRSVKRLVLRYPATAAMAVALGVVYEIQNAMGGDLGVAVRLGAMQADRVVEHHELYRVFAAGWLHHGRVHLFLNLMAFLQIASLVEFVWGGLRMAVVFVATGLVAALVVAAVGTYGLPAYGASGGVLGLAGLVLVSRWTADPTLRLFLQEAVGHRLTVAVASTFVAGLLLEMSLPDVVSGWGHLGAFAAGGVLAFSAPEADSGRELYRTLGVGTALALLVSAGAVVWHGDRAMATHDHDMARVLLHRASADPGSFAAYMDLLDMLEHYESAGEAEEGLARFSEQVSAFDDERFLEALYAQLYVADESDGPSRPEAEQVVLERWLELQPHDPGPLNAMAWHLVTRPDEARRDPERSAALARKALRRIPPQDGTPWLLRASVVLSGGDPTGPRSTRASVLDTLGEALFQSGRVEEAVEVQRESVQIATELELSQLAEMQERLARFEARTP